MATALLVALLMGVPSGAGGGVLACLFRRYLGPNRKMTSSVRRQVAINVLICGVVLLLAWLALAFVFSLTLKQSFAASCWTSFSAILGLIFVAFLGSWLYGRCVRGRILLDCGPLAARGVFLLISALSVFAFFDFSVSCGIPASAGFSLAGLLFASSFGVFWLIMAFGRLQVTEHGIWQYCSLLRWNKVVALRSNPRLISSAPMGQSARPRPRRQAPRKQVRMNFLLRHP